MAEWTDRKARRGKRVGWRLAIVAPLLTACQRGGTVLPLGAHALHPQPGVEEPFARGPRPGGEFVISAGGCAAADLQEAHVALWTPGLVTPGGQAVRATVTPAEDPAAAEAGEVWLTFPVETGVGEGTVALWWSPAAGLARLPLGGRPGELDLRLSVGGQTHNSADAAVASVAEERKAWDSGAFILRTEAGESVGAVQLQGSEAPAAVGVWDALWLTQGMVAAERLDQGGDLLLAFPAQPSAEGEDALLRLNVVTRRVVVPAGPQPTPDDRWLLADPGEVNLEQIDGLRKSAMDAADALERAWLEDAAPRLTRDADHQGKCASPVEAQPAWELLLTGYTVSAARTGQACVVGLEANPPQHRRRFSGWLGADGVLPRKDWPGN